MNIRSALDWFGFGVEGYGRDHSHGSHGHDSHGHGAGHGHTHGVVDPTIVTTTRGIWAIKWSFVMLAITDVAQLIIVGFSGSVALLADTIHNVGDAATAIPLWIAFVLVRRGSSPRFTYGLGRVEDLAGVIIVLIILFSAIIAGWQAIDRLLNPEPIAFLGWVAAAGVFGFLGNEAVAVFRIRVGREIASAALIADGYHARVDGLTSLAVVLGALGVWLGFPLADPIVGLLITAAILGIVWQSGRAIFTRMLDGIEPGVTEEIRHAAEHVPGIRRVDDVRARWIGHRMVAELDIGVDSAATVGDADKIASALEKELSAHIPAFLSARIRVKPHRLEAATSQIHKRQDGHVHGPAGHHHAPAPVKMRGRLAQGLLEIIETPAGARMRFTVSQADDQLRATVAIKREGGETEVLPLRRDGPTYESDIAPAEPHELTGELRLDREGQTETLAFVMSGPGGHPHQHS